VELVGEYLPRREGPLWEVCVFREYGVETKGPVTDVGTEHPMGDDGEPRALDLKLLGQRHRAANVNHRFTSWLDRRAPRGVPALGKLAGASSRKEPFLCDAGDYTRGVPKV
jgi:hypothetical protein